MDVSTTMGLIDWLLLILVAALCGSIGQGISGYSRRGCLVSSAIGFIGAFFGMWIADKMGLPDLFTLNIGGTHFPIIWSIIGSALFVALLGLLGAPKK